MDTEADPLDLDRAQLPMDGPGLALTEVFLQYFDRGRGTVDRDGPEPCLRALLGLRMGGAVIAFREPRREPGVEFLEGGRGLSTVDLGFELVLERAVKALDQAAALRFVGAGMDEVDAQQAAGSVKTVRTEGAAIVQVLWPV